MDENFKLDDWVSGKATSTPPTCASNTHFHIDHDRSTLAASELRVKLKAKDTVKAAPAAPSKQLRALLKSRCLNAYVICRDHCWRFSGSKLSQSEKGYTDAHTSRCFLNIVMGNVVC